MYTGNSHSKIFIEILAFDINPQFEKHLIYFKKHVTEIDELIKTRDPENKWSKLKDRIPCYWTKLEVEGKQVSVKYRLDICNPLDTDQLREFEEN